jgi:hypothetical protein
VEGDSKTKVPQVATDTQSLSTSWVAELNSKGNKRGRMEDEQNKRHCWTQWLTPVILATQEAEIRRISVRHQPYLRKKKKKITKQGWWSGSRWML